MEPGDAAHNFDELGVGRGSRPALGESVVVSGPLSERRLAPSPAPNPVG